MTNTLEQAAKAAYLKNPVHNRLMDVTPWEDLPPGIRIAWRGVARAILGALMEPDEAMLKSGESAWMNRRLDDPASEPIKDCWQAMLTEAKGDPTCQDSLQVGDDAKGGE